MYIHCQCVKGEQFQLKSLNLLLMVLCDLVTGLFGNVFNVRLRSVLQYLNVHPFIISENNLFQTAWCCSRQEKFPVTYRAACRDRRPFTFTSHLWLNNSFQLIQFKNWRFLHTNKTPRQDITNHQISDAVRQEHKPLFPLNGPSLNYHLVYENDPVSQVPDLHLTNDGQLGLVRCKFSFCSE